jgi:hypothetical protein
VLEDCTITDNYAPYEGGGVWGAPTLRRCTVAGNASYDGGGILLTTTGGEALVEDCVITENRAQEGSRGAGVYVGIPARIRGCLIVNNVSSGSGGMTSVQGAGVHVSGPTQARLEHCTIVDNVVEDGSVFGDNWGGVFGSATLVDCIVRGNDAAVQVDARASVTFSNVEGGFPGAGNLDLDPLFADAFNGDYHLLAGSPCIDAGDPAGALDPDHTRAEVGAFYFPQAGVLLRNGTGANRVGFTSLAAPVVGGTWHARIDSSGHPGVLLATFLVVERPLRAPLRMPAGELLIDPRSTVLARRSQPASGGLVDFTVGIPANAALIGFHATAQATLLGGGDELLNALDLALGH